MLPLHGTTKEQREAHVALKRAREDFLADVQGAFAKSVKVIFFRSGLSKRAFGKLLGTGGTEVMRWMEGVYGCTMLMAGRVFFTAPYDEAILRTFYDRTKEAYERRLGDGR